MFDFSILRKSSDNDARCGLLKTPHGSVSTPNFFVCATHGAVKGLTTLQAKEAGIDLILSNTYHMFLRPGPDLVESHGGLHKFLNWEKPMLTDSGGFQIFSLGYGGVVDEIKGSRNNRSRTLVKIEEEGALFKSYLDGRLHWLTPEKSIQIQQKLGADLVVVLDECTPFHLSRDAVAQSMERSHRWEKRSLEHFQKNYKSSQRLYGIVQGGVFPELRRESAEFVSSNDFFGQAIGGSLGGSKEQMREVVSYAMKYLKKDRPTHLLGIGGLADIIYGVEAGIDTFDCVHPTRIARHGCALTFELSEKRGSREHINLKNSCFKEDLSPIDSACSCYCCKNFTKAYLHHLLKSKESTAGQLLTVHNLSFMARFMKEVREAIMDNRWEEMKLRTLKLLT